MTVIEEFHADHGATFRSVGGRRVVEDYGRPERTHRAVRNGVGVCEMGYGVVEVSGEDRVDFVDNAVSNRVSSEDGRGVYALLLDPQGRITTDLYVYTTADRLLVFCPPERADPLAEQWRENTFIQDVSIRVATSDFGVFGVHGPYATEKIASVLNHAGAPEPALTFVRGSMGDAGVTVVAGDGLTGEDGYEVICAADAAHEVFETLVLRGNNAAPFGYRTWETLTLEAGTPLFDTELAGRIPNVAGVRNALDFEKGCYVGQEVVSKVENVGQPSKRLVGLAPESVPEAGDTVFAGDERVGEVTRAATGPSYETPVALAYVDFDATSDVTAVGVLDDEGTEEPVPADVVALPFVEGSVQSARLPTYPES
ncbi:CAF17-like 4Fe-4S cluster assembly/insertion protein YgfZ [Halomarina oriensis]|uniref:Aminomethyl transferase family protein n=1 Tax=Halomarina oriensis TaxID=671145 RepID=A0A6B0GLN9_9EURY|nr:aminomethyltransferase family protein [Halomarina oriensis]MWG35570.1 aminomethyl transferase family protein [Halomarina oriensis]